MALSPPTPEQLIGKKLPDGRVVDADLAKQLVAEAKADQKQRPQAWGIPGAGAPQAKAKPDPKAAPSPAASEPAPAPPDESEPAPDPDKPRRGRKPKGAATTP